MPGTYSFEELLRLLAGAACVQARLVQSLRTVDFVLTRQVGQLLRDVVLTRDEFDGLMWGC